MEKSTNMLMTANSCFEVKIITIHLEWIIHVLCDIGTRYQRHGDN